MTFRLFLSSPLKPLKTFLSDFFSAYLAMPNKCSALSCRSNYDGEPHTPIFKMLNDQPCIVSHRKRFLHRQRIDEIRKIYVCLQHFRDEERRSYSSNIQPDGSIL